MAEKTVATKENGGKGKKLDEYDVYCKLKALAVLLSSLHNYGLSLSSNECYGIELLLNNIADEIDPSQRRNEGGAA